MTDLKSSIESQGRYVTQIIHGVNGTKHTFAGIDTQSIKQGQFTKMLTKDGRMIMVNDKNVIIVEVFKDEV